MSAQSSFAEASDLGLKATGRPGFGGVRLAPCRGAWAACALAIVVIATVSLDDGGTTISPPELIARGVGEDPGLVDDLREEAGRIAAELSSNGLTEIKLVQEHIHDAIGQAVYDRTRRRPMILPVVIEV